MPTERQRLDDRLPPILVPVPKPSGGIRHLARLAPDDARDLERVVAPVALRLGTLLAPGAVASRIRSASPLRLEPWTGARRRYRRALGDILGPGVRAVLLLDVAECYASIRPDAVEAAVRELGLADAARHLGRLLRSLRERGVPGLPIGPPASAVLADAVLRPLDEAFAERAPHLRWVDDVVAPADTQRAARRSLDAALRTLQGLGLAPNRSKTRLVTDPAELRSVLPGAGRSGAPR